ncbi:MAG TPA: tetratricopeptide repeat protein, partial [Vampirovibrionales bacterium]
LEASRGEFKLFIARCNYIQLRERLVQRLQQLCELEIRRIEVKESDRLLHSRVRVELGEEQPDALMVFGLETVTEINPLLSSANQVREEFQKQFHFPLVLWVNDEVQQKIRQIAPDLESWAIPVQLTMDREAIATFVTETAQAWFANQLPLTRQSALKLLGELAPAQIDLISQPGLDEELNANLESLLGAVQFILGQPDIALDHYQQATKWWNKSQQLERLGKIYHQIAVCHYIKARQQRNLDPSDWQPTREAISHCLAAFEQTQNPHLIADSLESIGKILRQLPDWDTLQTLATHALSIHEAENQPIETARDYGFLAEVALSQSNWTEAKELAEKALEILGTVPGFSFPNSQSPIDENPSASTLGFDASLYYFILAQAEQKLNQPEAALRHLEAAKQAGSPDHDTQLYRDIL